MVTLYAQIADVREEAAKLDPVKVFLTLVGLPFFVLFFLARFAWMVPAFLWTSGFYGWRQAEKFIKARTAEPAG